MTALVPTLTLQIFPPCIYVFPVPPTINSDYFPTQHSSAGLFNGESMRSL